MSDSDRKMLYTPCLRESSVDVFPSLSLSLSMSPCVPPLPPEIGVHEISLQQFREFFERYDTDGSGALSCEEFRNFVKQFFTGGQVALFSSDRRPSAGLNAFWREGKKSDCGVIALMLVQMICSMWYGNYFPDEASLSSGCDLDVEDDFNFQGFEAEKALVDEAANPKLEARRNVEVHFELPSVNLALDREEEGLLAKFQVGRVAGSFFAWADGMSEVQTSVDFLNLSDLRPSGLNLFKEIICYKRPNDPAAEVTYFCSSLYEFLLVGRDWFAVEAVMGVIYESSPV